LTDAHWARIEGRLPGREGLPGRRGVDNRRFVDAVLWLARTAAAWRDLPPEFGKWTGVHARFRRWALAGVAGLKPAHLLACPSGWPGGWTVTGEMTLENGEHPAELHLMGIPIRWRHNDRSLSSRCSFFGAWHHPPPLSCPA
jgi:hypothetical protein